MSLKQNSGIQGHNMRHKSGIHTRYCSTVLCQKSATNMGISCLINLIYTHATVVPCFVREAQQTWALDCLINYQYK
jgi:NAD-dependent oxidoreductase involved in siderophore biosynthesis